MADVSRILLQIEQGDPHAAAELLPLVYEELRRLAEKKMANERPGQTLDATGLVHEAYLRLISSPTVSQPTEIMHWNGRGHFFAAAAEAMRRILIEAARRKGRIKRGGDRARMELADVPMTLGTDAEELLALDKALDKLAAADPAAAKLVQLRFFVGLPIPEAAEVLGVSSRTADRLWVYARAFIHSEIGAE
jgi:RNA polymerase sigma factor (TIGR02999 family)